MLILRKKNSKQEKSAWENSRGPTQNSQILFMILCQNDPEFYAFFMILVIILCFFYANGQQDRGKTRRVKVIQNLIV